MRPGSPRGSDAHTLFLAPSRLCSSSFLTPGRLLQEAVERFKTRNHIVNQWVIDVNEAKRAKATKPVTSHTPFLESFLEGNYAKPLAVWYALQKAALFLRFATAVGC